MIKFVNLNKADFFKKRLYRFITVSKLKNCLIDNEICFSRPEKWKDPYENYYLNARYKWKRNDMLLPAKGNVFCLCFTERYNSEAYWLTYAPKEDGIRMEFNKFKLFNKLNRLRKVDVYIGKVIYQNQTSFANIPKVSQELKLDISKLQKEIKSGQIDTEQIKLMLIKRKAFLYEEEIRIFIIPKEAIKDKTFNLAIDLKDVITKCHLDPRFDETNCTITARELINLYGIDEAKIGALKFPTFWFDSTPQGKFMMNIAFGQSKYYIDNLSLKDEEKNYPAKIDRYRR